MKKTTVLLFILRFIKIAVSFFTLSLTAKYFGVSLDKDVWILAFSSMLVFDNAVWGPINETFRAKFIFLRNEFGENEALNKTKGLLFYSLIISIVMVLFVCFFPILIAKIIAPSFEGEQLEALLTMLIFVAPCLLFNQLSKIGISILNAYESFYIPEISGFITSVINLLLIILLAPHIGIYSLLISYYIGLLILLVLIFLQIQKLDINLFSLPWNKEFNDFKIFILFALPFFFPYFVGQISGIVEKNLVSSIGVGMVSEIDYSRKFSEILSSVLTSVLATMMVPILSLNFAQKKPKEFVNNFLQIFQLGFLLLTFFVAIFTSCSLSFVKLLYDKGSISDSSLLEISELTMYYSWTTIAVFIYLIFGMVLLSSGQGKKYAFWGVIAQLISIIANILLIDKYGVFVIPFSLFFSHLLSGFCMFYRFPYKTKIIYIIPFKYLSVLLLTVLCIKIFNFFVDISAIPFYNLALNSVVTAFVMIMLSFLFKLEEANLAIEKIKLYLKK